MSTPTPLARAKVHPYWEAFRSFCDLAREPRLQTSHLRSTPWARFPEVLPHLPGDPDTLTTDHWVQASQRFLDAVTGRLLADLPESARRSSPLWVVRRNNVDGEILEALVDEVCDPHGRPYKIDQIKKMKQRGIAELFLWALQEPEFGTDTGPDIEMGVLPLPSPPTAPMVPVSTARPWWVPVVFGLLLLAAIWQLFGSDASTPRYNRPGLYGGWENRWFHTRELPHIQESLGLQPHPLPDLGFTPFHFHVIEPVDGSGPRLLLSPLHGDPQPGRIALWNPVTGELDWESGFVPPRDRILTHATLDSTTLDAPFAAAAVLSGSTVPDRILVTYHNDFSPSFAVQFDRDSGQVLSCYAHPGRLESGLVLDLDGDGIGSFVLAGHDNVRQRPVVLALAPSDEDAAASTVQWNQAGEGAEVRCLLPDARAFQEAAGIPQLDVQPLAYEAWLASTGRLRVDTRHREGRVVYTAYLDRDLRVTEVTLGEAVQTVWREFGLDPATALESLGEPIRE